MRDRKAEPGAAARTRARAVGAVERLEDAREFGVRPPVRAIFDHPTARGLGEVIEKAVIAEIRELADAGPEPTAGPGRGPEPG